MLRRAARLLQSAPVLPPLGPGTLLRLKEPKAPVLVEVKLDSGRKLDAFSEPPSPVGGAPRPSWGPLDVPPASGYLYEQLLQRIADDLPPELLALVEARRLLGQELRERRDRQREEEAGGVAARCWALVLGRAESHAAHSAHVSQHLTQLDAHHPPAIPAAPLQVLKWRMAMLLRGPKTQPASSSAATTMRPRQLRRPPPRSPPGVGSRRLEAAPRRLVPGLVQPSHPTSGSSCRSRRRNGSARLRQRRLS